MSGSGITHYLAVYPATGDLYQVCAGDETQAYRILAREVLGLADWNENDFFLGNVDFDLYILKNVACGQIITLEKLESS